MFISLRVKLSLVLKVLFFNISSDEVDSGVPLINQEIIVLSLV